MKSRLTEFAEEKWNRKGQNWEWCKPKEMVKD
jgi:hypothetical protein